MRLLSIIFAFGCVTADITKVSGEFPDNPTDDYDGDGLTEQNGDCDDLNPDVLGPSQWFADADGDGFGDPSQAVEACLNALLALDDSTNYVDNSDDCNDTDSSIFPNNARYEAEELCVQDADGDGYGDAIPTVSADPGNDCNDSDPFVYPGYNNEQGQLCVLDADGDGYGQLNAPQPYDSGTDCNDDDSQIHPNRDDGCDGIDNNCDGQTDESPGNNAPFWYYDSDLDGYGNPDVPLIACSAPSGYVADYSDCDDSDASNHPNAPEVCDGKDNNCNSITDEDSAIDVLSWFADSDGDGYGDPATVNFSCTQPSGFVDNFEDCNDLSNAQYPGAPEVCNGLDDSCDGQIDEGVLNTYYIDSDGDSFGTGLQSVQACSALPGTVADSSDCDDTDPLVNPNASETCNLRDDDCNGLLDDDAIDATVFYIDSDGDGRGEPSQTVQTCPIFNGVSLAPDGYSFFDDDCDDNDPNRAPSLPELCSTTVDENCDGDPTLGALDVSIFYADNDADGQGNPLYTVAVCEAPYGYVGNSDDCNDTDSEVLSGMPVEWEICNGKLDRCEGDDGSLTPPDIELDDDGDYFVDCVLDVDPLQWADQSLGVIGGGDCEDDDPDAYPGATEKCNGVIEDFKGDGLCDEILPEDESDDDSDGYVECSGYELQPWEGDSSVVGGEDCNDNSDFTFPGAAINSPGVCSQDLNNDGDPDCNLTGIHPDYVCDTGVFPNVGEGPDFVLIPAGDDPLGNYSISFDFYMMTTEVTEAMWDALMGNGTSTALTAKNNVNWHESAMFANALSTLRGKEECYTCSGSTCTEAILPITDCLGYRLPTEWEWEYAARSGTTSEYWTGEGLELGGDSSSLSSCDGTETILDGVNTPLLSEYAWFCGNSGLNIQSVAQKRPNGFGLYDMHGNVWEFTTDWWDYFLIPSGSDPWSDIDTGERTIRGGDFGLVPSELRVSTRSNSNPIFGYASRGFRLVIRVP